MENYRDAVLTYPVLETARLLLRRPDAGDLPTIVAICSDFAVSSLLGRVPHPYSDADGRYFLDTLVPGEIVWAVVDRSNDRVLGMMGLALDQDHDVIELGYYFAPSAWGRGFATEAGSAVMAHGLALFGGHRIKAGYFVENPASGRVLEKLGFRETGRSERPCLAAGWAKPSVEMAWVGDQPSTAPADGSQA